MSRLLCAFDDVQLDFDNTDTAGRDSFTLPNIVTSNFYNTTCTSDRSSCAAVASYCP